MAVTHSAYLFDPITFHQELREKIIHENRLDEEAMRDLARTTAEHASSATQHALRYLRYDAEWLEWPDPEVSYHDKWYVISLAGAVTLAPSLSHRSQFSWLILRQGLPVVGWTASHVEQLVQGNPLPSLLESSELAPQLGPMAKFLYQYGGWLRASEAQDSEAHLFQSREQLLNPSARLKSALLEVAGWLSERPPELLEKAYADAVDMLRAAVQTRKALFMILD